MENIKTPEGYQAIIPYLIADDAEELLHFLTEGLGATEMMKYLHDNGKIMHAEVRLSGGVIMLANATEKWAAGMNSTYVYVHDVDALFKQAVNAGGTSVMEPTDQSYGRSGGVKDPGGNTWWLVTAPE